jgi:hypothetical protein
MTTEEMAEVDFPGAKELAAMFDFMLQTDKYERSQEDTKKLHPGIPDFATWMDDNKEAFLAALQ